MQKLHLQFGPSQVLIKLLKISRVSADLSEFGKATITRCDLSPDSFVLMLRYCANLKAISYESTSLNKIVANKSHRVIVA